MTTNTILPTALQHLNTKSELAQATARISFAAYLHDLGKLTERSKPDEFTKTQIDIAKSQFCPVYTGKYSHIHAAFTALSWDKIAEFMPPNHDAYPFVKNDQSKTLIQSAASHHQIGKDTSAEFLHWLVAVADRVSSGFERSNWIDYNNISEDDEKKDTPAMPNYLRDRLLSIFHRMTLTDKPKNYTAGADGNFYVPLKPLTVETCFAQEQKSEEQQPIIPKSEKEAIEEYRILWKHLNEKLAEYEKNVPITLQNNWDRFTESFDSLWHEVAHSIPSATSIAKAIPDVSLYDHSRTAAALAGSIWRFYAENGKEDNSLAKEYLKEHRNKEKREGEAPFLLIQGDFSGIQNFLFRQGGAAQSNAAKILRGRSFYISLLTELAAVKILDGLALPASSQIINTAGKFLIVAPNTQWCRMQLDTIKKEIADWFFTETLGLVQFNIATTCATFTDFEGKNFGELQKKLFNELAIKKYQSELPEQSVFQNIAYPNGVCQIDGFFPAETILENNENHVKVCKMVADQIKLGQKLVQLKNPCLIISEKSMKANNDDSENTLGLQVFGYYIELIDRSEFTKNVKKYNFLEANYGANVRIWDLTPLSENGAFAGFPNRFYNGYIPKEQNNKPLTFEEIASGGTGGACNLGFLKGDVNDLSVWLQYGFPQENASSEPTKSINFARMCSFSRQLNLFFACYLPHLCKNDFPEIYTVFSGGDDFCLIGHWDDIQKLALRLREDFTQFCANNKEFTFAAGIAMHHHQFPVYKLAHEAENALEASKSNDDKGSITIFNQTVEWDDFEDLKEIGYRIATKLNAEQQTYSTGLVYPFIDFAKQAGLMKDDNKIPLTDKVQAALYRSRATYHLARFAQRNKKKGVTFEEVTFEELTQLFITEGLEIYDQDFIIALFNGLYAVRE